ncbi:MAG: hypothetical protein CL521_06160 [Actinobacteria bacterium]|nr:hypothetical protein [Actinomycetota bacterium]|tara:strand:+ start:553 stop:1626 length:1074 start_codon:yes stop_codon:yes gene_type:complete
MAMGYALGNHDNLEGEINVVEEDQSDLILYSAYTNVYLTHMKSQPKSYLHVPAAQHMAVPYTTIKYAKDGRLKGAREGLYTSIARPDHRAEVRSALELWGFNNFVEYIYTVAELGFLEGLIPVLDVGILTPAELQKLQEVCALIVISHDSISDYIDTISDSVMPFEKRQQFRYKMLEWAGKLSLPTIGKIAVSEHKAMAEYTDYFKALKERHSQYQNIHELILDVVVAHPRLPQSLKPISKKKLLRIFEQAKNILPDDINVVIPSIDNEYILDLVDAGLRDLGRVDVDLIASSDADNPILEVAKALEKKGYTLQQRFPLKKDFIKNEAYSKKLGQVFDSYRYKIKKDIVDKQRETKS